MEVKLSGLAPLLILLGTGVLLALFASFTVHRRTDAELRAHGGPPRAQRQIAFWEERGYFASGGLMIVPGAFYRSSTGGVYLSTFVMQKLLPGAYSYRATAIHNQILLMLTSTCVALLALRLLTQLGASRLHALLLAVAVQAVHFTFPDNLMTYWETSPKIAWLLFACLFLLFEERPVLQGVCAFFMTYMDLVAGVAFIAAYFVVALLIAEKRPSWKRTLAPMFLALAVYAGQIAWVRAAHPETPRKGSSFVFRSGLDGGSTDYYLDHLDIARRRDLIRRGFVWAGFPGDASQLFRWKWVFVAGSLAFAVSLFGARRTRDVVVALLSLLGAYLICAAVFSQEVMIHPYFYDVMLFTPLMIALFAIAPALAERAMGHRGIVVAIALLLALGVAMMQLRRYAVLFPPGG